jgi:putative FmdB family regulatory protein
MPVYGYRCTNSHHFEVQQRITEAPLTKCPECGAPVTRVFYPVGIIFKGGGFYKTDSRGAGSDGTSTPPATPKTETKDKTDTKAKTAPDGGSSAPTTPPPAKTDDTSSTKEGAA